MPNLTDLQLVLLSAASQREDGLVPLGDRLTGQAARAFGDRLMRLGLAVAVTGTGSGCVWIEREDGVRLGLRITPAGLNALGLENAAAHGVQDAGPAFPADPATRDTAAKATVILNLLLEDNGSSLTEIGLATGWQPHTIRGWISRQRKAGRAIATVSVEGGSRYRLERGISTIVQSEGA